MLVIVCDRALSEGKTTSVCGNHACLFRNPVWKLLKPLRNYSYLPPRFSSAPNKVNCSRLIYYWVTFPYLISATKSRRMELVTPRRAHGRGIGLSHFLVMGWAVQEFTNTLHQCDAGHTRGVYFLERRGHYEGRKAGFLACALLIVVSIYFFL